MAMPVAEAIRSTMLSGVAFGANRPNHPVYLSSGKPDSIAVGIPDAPRKVPAPSREPTAMSSVNLQGR
jgi:hypothetical protein